MRYIGQDKNKIYLKCRHCNTIFSFDKKEFNKRENSRCSDCKKGLWFIWRYPIAIPQMFKTPTLLIMTVLSVVILSIICFPVFQRFYFFNKAVTALNPLGTSLLMSALCSFPSILLPDSFGKGLEKAAGEGKRYLDNVKRRSLFVVVIECIFLIFVINVIMQTQYCSLKINDLDTGEIQQYFGNATGEFASGTGRLFNSQGKLVYEGEFKNNLFDGYGRRFELIDTIHNTEASQSYQCVYEGFYKNGLPNGEGKEYRYDAEYTFEKGENVDPNLHYEGSFMEGEYCGYGTLYEVESKYEGVFFDGEFNGYGSQWLLGASDKKIDKYEGNYLNGKLNGTGKAYYSDGTILFEGNYESGRAVMGTSYFDDGNIRYTGEWSNRVYDGKGTLYWKNGSIRFEGDWVEGKRKGSGSSFREDGTLEYIGGWEDDKYSGYGKLYYEDGITLQYDGRYNNGIQSGNGEEYYRDGTVRYSGNWKDGTLDGQGIWFWENGKPYYEGGFENGKRHGFGIMYSEDGKISYEGNFRDDYYNGEGIHYWANGNIKYEGEWCEGDYSGEGKEYDEDGNLIHEGIFTEGEFVSSLSDS